MFMLIVISSLLSIGKATLDFIPHVKEDNSPPTSQFLSSPVITSYISIILPAAVVGKGKAATLPSHGISSF